MAICCFAIYANYPAFPSNNMKAKPSQVSRRRAAGADHPDPRRSRSGNPLPWTPLNRGKVQVALRS